MTIDAGPARPALSESRRVWSIVAASSGNLVEWFDFYLYSFSAVYFAPAFFPKSAPTVQLLNTAGVFAAGFLMRPVGGWLFGRIADRHGRRTSLVISVTMMGSGSLAIACLPTYARIGAWAPLGLLLARLLQGLSVGGEYGTTATYLSEIAAGGRRGYLSSYQYVTLIGGQLLAVLVIVVLGSALSDARMKAWGWRLPFVLGAFAALGALFLRRSLRETVRAAAPGDAAAGSLRELFGRHRAAFFSVLGFTAGGSLAFYTFTTYMQKWLVNSAGMSIAAATHVMTVCLFLYMCMQPLFGALSDRVGRRNCMLWFSGLLALGTVPIMQAMRAVQAAHNPAAAGALVVLALAALSFYTSISALVKADLFPAEVRAVGVGLAYAVGNAAFGGSAEYAALWLKTIGHEYAFYWYVTAMMVVAFATSLRLPRRGRGYLA